MSCVNKISRHPQIYDIEAELSDNDFKAAIIKMIQEGRVKTCDKNLKIEIINKAIEKKKIKTKNK